MSSSAAVNVKIASSNIDWARYDPETNTLEIDFIKSNVPGKASTYEYTCFPPEEWEQFQMSESKGSWFAKYVRYAKDAQGDLKYPFKRIR